MLLLRWGDAGRSAEDVRLISPNPLQGVRGDRIALLDLSIEQNRDAAGQERVEQPDLLPAQLEQALSESRSMNARTGHSPRSLAYASIVHREQALIRSITKGYRRWLTRLAAELGTRRAWERGRPARKGAVFVERLVGKGRRGKPVRRFSSCLARPL